ncbi:MAG: hypothetical protein KatS3mg082_1534 [Nitrospiraceae bacterium]|nr:MAG: hypothetical protein KatS3mg082_1534 [Nitrospiraceae bacterium]
MQVPVPARFAWHELIVSGARLVSVHGKSAKDNDQAAQALLVLAEERPGDVMGAWESIECHGAGWIRTCAGGVYALHRKDPSTHEKVLDALPAVRARRPVG